MTYDIIWQTYQKEKQTNRLFPLQTDFYSEAKRLITAKNTNPDIENTKRTNITHIISKIKEKRTQKILLYIAYNKQIETPIPLEETNLYNKLIQILTESQNITINEMQIQKLNVLQTIPEIFLPSGNKTGPLNKSDKIQIENKSDKEFLITSMLCELYTN